SLHNNKLIAMEVLSRFKFNNGMQAPAIKILKMLSQDVKNKLLNKQLEWITANKKFFIENNIICSVNVDDGLCTFIYEDERIQKIIKENNFLAFEISESHPNLDMDDRVIDFLFSLSGYIWLDDFGSSNATMSAVIKRPYHAIKIDKCFLQHNIENHTISETIKRIKEFVPHVIAEGIENDVYHKMSVELDLWGGQGYYFLNTNMSPHCEMVSNSLSFDFLKV
ncbi:TPA: EAL domain-containing protein, partial [Escherichia coli]|nr:EAL domain-containing protein [Escherichia coli]